MNLQAIPLNLADQPDGTLLVIDRNSELVYHVDGPGSAVLRIIVDRGSVSWDDLLKAMMEVYSDAPADQVSGDTAVFINELEASGLVRMIQNVP